MPIPVHPVAISDRISLHEPPKRRRIDPRLVMPHPQLGQPRLPGIAEPPDIARCRNAIFIIAVQPHRRARAVGDAHHAAALVGHQETAVAKARALVPDDRIVDAGAVHIAAQHRADDIQFDGPVDTVIAEPSRSARGRIYRLPPDSRPKGAFSLRMRGRYGAGIM